jgi:hypothetical protein
MVPTPGSSWTKRHYVAAPARVRLNYALERSVRGFSERAAGARNNCAPSARRPRSAARSTRTLDGSYVARVSQSGGSH